MIPETQEYFRALDERRGHVIVPELIRALGRYRCKLCRSGISYSEETGKWRHM